MINIEIKESKMCNGQYSLFISFDYNPEIVSIVKSFPTRVYNREDVTWELPLNKLGVLVDKLSEYDITISGKYVELETQEVKLPPYFKFCTEPYEHQIEGVKYGLSHDKWLLGDEQGLGKTKQVIDIARARQSKHCLIICCVNGLKWNWKEEVQKHAEEDARILGQRTNRNNRVVIGSNQERLDDLQDIDELPRFIITNIETLRYKVKTGRKIKKRRGGKEQLVDEYRYPITERLKELCNSGVIDMIAVDEFHKCKNPEAEQAEQILELQAAVQIAMTGTPLMNTPLDLYMPLNWLGYERHSFWQFKTHHCYLGGFGGHEVVGYKNLEEITDTLDEMMLRRLKDEVLDLPEKTYVTEYVELGKAQSRVYDIARNEVLGKLDKIKMSNNPLTELIRLRQATGNPNILTSDCTENAKFERAEELIEDAVTNGQKVVIFSNWTDIINPLFTRLINKYKGTTITGEVKEEQRQINKNQFQEDEKTKFIAGTIGAMGTGYTLNAGSVVILLDEAWNKALIEQAVDRLHRIGQKNNITIYTLIAKDTIDERIHDIVEKKGAMAEILVDGKIEGDKNALINYLLS